VIVERVSGLKYEDYLRKNIFEPLQMTATGYAWPSAILEDRAAGYSKDDGGKQINADFLDMGQPYAAGSPYSTVLDLYKWDRAPYTTKVLSAQSLEAAFTPAPVEIRVSPGLLEPAVIGSMRPVLLLPQGIAERLTPAEMKAVLDHELCHVRRRDNLLASIHMIVETMFWFHPLVWWIAARLLDERERACDEGIAAAVRIGRNGVESQETNRVDHEQSEWAKIELRPEDCFGSRCHSGYCDASVGWNRSSAGSPRARSDIPRLANQSRGQNGIRSRFRQAGQRTVSGAQRSPGQRECNV